jgi:hypothetical protein
MGSRQKWLPLEERRRKNQRQFIRECLISVILIIGAGLFIALNEQTCNPCNRHPDQGLPTKNPPLAPSTDEVGELEGGDELEL